MTDSKSERNDESAWAGLLRRKVVQWSVAYTVAAWGLVQAVGFAVDTFQWPGVLTRIAVVIAVTGLPVAITLAWFHGDRGNQKATRVEIAVVALLVVLSAYAVRYELRRSPAAESSAGAGATSEVSAALDPDRIAILPFDNLGGEAANAAFVGGVHDTLITQVAKIPGLSVISRSSVLQFADKHPTIKEVVAALAVGTVLAGSVEREGDRLRIQAQLIDARSDDHLWAESYDRRADDLFAVQSEIAQAVAEQLRKRLTKGDSQRLTTRLTSQPAAYEHYVLGRNLVSRGQWQDAIGQFTAAVTIDPDFAAAHAQLGLARTWSIFKEPDLRKEILPLAKASIDRALELDPSLPEAHLALANYLYRGEPDIPRAAAEFQRAIAGLPSDADAYHFFGLLRRWQHRWEESTALFQRAAQLNPSGDDTNYYVLGLVVLDRYDEAAAAIEKARNARPDDAALAVWTGDLAFNIACDLSTMERVLHDAAARFSDAPTYVSDEWAFSMATGDIERSLGTLGRLREGAWVAAEAFPLIRALTYLAAGRRPEAQLVLQPAIEQQQRIAEAQSAGELRALAYAYVAAGYALMGDRAAAVDYAVRAVAELPPAGEGSNREDAIYWSAVALGQVGEHKLATERMRDLLVASHLLKAPGLWCDPFLEPLRADPEYRRLMAQHGTDVRIDPRRRETWPPSRFAPTEVESSTRERLSRHQR